MKTNQLVECRELTKVFPGCVALDRVDLTLGRGRIIGLLGPTEAARQH